MHVFLVSFMSAHNRFATLNTKFQKGDKGDIANAKMYTFLEQNIGGKTFLRLRK